MLKEINIKVWTYYYLNDFKKIFDKKLNEEIYYNK